jgi:hypothetical protein
MTSRVDLAPVTTLSAKTRPVFCVDLAHAVASYNCGYAAGKPNMLGLRHFVVRCYLLQCYPTPNFVTCKKTIVTEVPKGSFLP